MRKNQQFVWDLIRPAPRGSSLIFFTMPEAEREKGHTSFARLPPMDDEFLTSKIYDQQSATWRYAEPSPPLSPEKSKEIVERANALKNSQDVLPSRIGMKQDDFQMISGTPQGHNKTQGSWWQWLPKDLPDQCH